MTREASRTALAAMELQLEASASHGPVLFHGRSMEPFLRDGDGLRVEPVAWHEIRPGDLVTYRLAKRFPTMRVMQRFGDKLVLVADNWPGRRFEAWREHVLGRVVTRHRDGRTLSSDALRWRAYTGYRLLRCKAALARARLRRLRDRMRSLRMRRRREPFRRPPNVQVNLSSSCNLACRMCVYLPVHRDATRLDLMSRETFEALLPLVREIGGVHLSGAGEPLYHPQLLEFVELVRREVPRATISLTTNGTMLRASTARRLIEAGLDKVHVSFDGLPGTVEGIRRGIHGEQVLRNVRRLAELARELGSAKPVIQFNYMVGYGTYRELPAFVELAKEVGASEIQLLDVIPATGRDAAQGLVHEMEADGAAALREAVMLAQHAGVQLHLPTTTRDACYFPNHPRVGEDGEVYPCCFLDYDGSRLFDGTRETRLPPQRLGNVTREPFDRIWSSPAYAGLRERNARGDFDASCRTCYRIRARTSDRVEAALGR